MYKIESENTPEVPRGNPVPKQVLDLLSPLTFQSMYELGNKKTAGVPYSGFFRSKGIIYDSIDLNGMDGALPLNLCEPIDLPPRDLVSNIGTSEHVLDQHSCFRNIHNLSSARMVHWVPLQSWHPNHGLFGYTVDFFLHLAAENSYIVEKLYIETSYLSWKLICCSLQKTNPSSKFRWRKEWQLSANLSGEWGVSYTH
jgi:hypothetical protein